MQLLRNYLLLDDPPNKLNHIANWRISALRIMVASGMLLCLAVCLHVFSQAIALNLVYAIALSLSFFLLMALLLLASKRYYLACSHSLLLAIVFASLAMNLYLTDLELAKVGSMYMYSCPIIALMLLGQRSAIFYAVLNIVPFYMIITNVDLSGITAITQQLPSANLYITGLIFLFFNICMPLAVGRTIVAAKRLNETTIQSNEYLKQKQILYRTFFSQSNKAQIIVDKNNRISDFNEQAVKLFGSPTRGGLVGELLQLENPHSEIQSNQVIQYKNVYLRISHYCSVDSEFTVYGFYDCSNEMSAKQSLVILEQENKRLRYCDRQTQLPNRDWFEMQCEKLIARYSKNFYIVVMQSANTEYLNLTLKQTKSQHLLRKVYKQLKTHCEGAVLCAQVTDTQLAFILTAASAEDIQTIQLPVIKSQLDSDFVIFGEKISQTFLFGYAAYPNQGKSIVDALNNAISAVKLANTNDQPIQYYNEKLSQAFIEKHEISMLLDEAITQGEIELEYQPKVTALRVYRFRGTSEMAQ